MAETGRGSTTLATPEGGTSLNSGATDRSQRSAFISGVLVTIVGSIVVTGLTALGPFIWRAVTVPTLPSGAIVAFDRTDLTPDQPCPDGWRLYDDLKGRFVLGADIGDRAKTERRLLGNDGGKAAINLSVEQLPPHSHKVYYSGDAANNYTNGGWPMIKTMNPPNPALPEGKPFDASKEVYTNTSGKGAEIAILPPCKALYYCVKK
jgi:hypothetical protein